MAKTFSIPFTGDVASLLERAKKAVQSDNAQLTGDRKSGTFSGKGVKGDYEVTGNTVTVTIDEKPFLVPWSLVESQLKHFFQ